MNEHTPQPDPDVHPLEATHDPQPEPQPETAPDNAAHAVVFEELPLNEALPLAAGPHSAAAGTLRTDPMRPRNRRCRARRARPATTRRTTAPPEPPPLPDNEPDDEPERQNSRLRSRAIPRSGCGSARWRLRSCWRW